MSGSAMRAMIFCPLWALPMPTTERYLHTLPNDDETALTALSNIHNRSRA
jgi:hypothetical protein